MFDQKDVLVFDGDQPTMVVYVSDKQLKKGGDIYLQLGCFKEEEEGALPIVRSMNNRSRKLM